MWAELLGLCHCCSGPTKQIEEAGINPLTFHGIWAVAWPEPSRPRSLPVTPTPRGPSLLDRTSLSDPTGDITLLFTVMLPVGPRACPGLILSLLPSILNHPTEFLRNSLTRSYLGPPFHPYPILIQREKESLNWEQTKSEGETLSDSGADTIQPKADLPWQGWACVGMWHKFWVPKTNVTRLWGCERFPVNPSEACVGHLENQFDAFKRQTDTESNNPWSGRFQKCSFLCSH